MKLSEQVFQSKESTEVNPFQHFKIDNMENQNCNCSNNSRNSDGCFEWCVFIIAAYIVLKIGVAIGFAIVSMFN